MEKYIKINFTQSYISLETKGNVTNSDCIQAIKLMVEDQREPINKRFTPLLGGFVSKTGDEFVDTIMPMILKVEKLYG